MAKVNWTFVADGLNGAVVPTTDPVDGEEVFVTFSEARRELASWFDHVASAYRRAARDARGIRRADADMRLRNLEDPGAV